jgi:hypothetical protein
MISRIACLLALVCAASFQCAAAAPLARPSILLARPLATEPGWSDIAAAVLPVVDGAIVTGWSTGPDGMADGLILRVNSDGDVLWRKRVGGKGADLLWNAIPDGRGGFACAGFTSSEGAGSTDGWFVRFDSAGTILSQKTYGGPGDDRIVRLRRDSTGWMMAGQLAMADTALGMQAWVLRIDPEGAERSSWTWGGAGIDRAFGIEPAPGGGCVIAGLTGESREVASSFVTRLSPDGREQWAHREKKPGLQVGYDVTRAPDGNFVVAGYGFTSVANDRDGFVLRMDPRGRVVSRRTIGGPTYDRVDQALPFADASIAVLGYSQRPGARDDETHWDMVVHDVDARGEVTWTGRFGGSGVEFARGIAGTRDDLWVVGHTTSDRNGSAVYLVRLDLTGAHAAAQP